MEYKQLIIVRADLKLPKGKAAAQAAHAAVEAAWRARKEDVTAWRAQGMAKVVLKAADERELLRHLQTAKDAGFATALITDAGHTVVAPGTTTCLGVGPAPAAELDSHFSSLKLL
jgi:PTH2 family peptidyl-tRNA hydrolase